VYEIIGGTHPAFRLNDKLIAIDGVPLSRELGLDGWTNLFKESSGRNRTITFFRPAVQYAPAAAAASATAPTPVPLTKASARKRQQTPGRQSASRGRASSPAPPPRPAPAHPGPSILRPPTIGGATGQVQEGTGSVGMRVVGFLKNLFVGLFVLYLFVLFYAPIMDTLLSRMHRPACFQESSLALKKWYSYKVDGTLVSGDRGPCSGVPETELLPCPEDGICVDGRLVDCATTEHFELYPSAAAATACVLKPASQSIVKKMSNVLQSWTAASLCGGTGRGHHIPEPASVRSAASARTAYSTLPLFHYSDLLDVLSLSSYGELEALVNAANHAEGKPKFVLAAEVEPGKHSPVIGLAKTPPLTLMCSIRRVTAYTVNLAVAWASWIFWGVLALLEYSARSFWGAPLAEKVICVLALAVALLAFYAYRKRQAIRRFEEEIAIVHDVVVSVLKTDTRAHLDLAVRDVIQDERCGEKSHLRKYFVMKVWPCVVRRIERDERVKRIKRGGETRWQWDA